jgi:dTDP-glucose 4,6-dehydratase
MIAKLMSVEVDILGEDQRMRPDKSEVFRLWADHKRLTAATGWRPIYGGKDGFERGLMETIDWFVDPKHLSMYPEKGYTV